MHQLTALLQGLLSSGNQVTAVFARKTEIMHQNYEEIIVADGYVWTLKLFNVPEIRSPNKWL